jgi:hypothetical protein
MKSFNNRICKKATSNRCFFDLKLKVIHFLINYPILIGNININHLFCTTIVWYSTVDCLII